MLDLVLRGARIVDPTGIVEADLALAKGRVAARLRPGEPATALAELDVADRLLLPGLVDAHVHFREPGLTWKEDFAAGTRAAIAGGVTTALVMPTDDPWTTDTATFAEKRALAEGRIHADIGLQVAVARPAPDLAPLVAAGAVSFEIFTADVPSGFLHEDVSALTAALGAVAAAGGMAAVSAGDQSLLAERLAGLVPGRSSAADFVRSRPPEAEAQGIARAVLAAAARAVPLHIRQCGAALGMATWRRLRDLADVSIETSPQCLFFTEADYARLGPLAKASPPWRDAADRDAWRAALGEGLVDIVASDHAPHARAEKLANADDFASLPGGFPGVATLLPALLALVAEGVLDLPGLVRVASTRPAERFGLGRRKGRLAGGFDADLLVLDPIRPTRIEHAAHGGNAGFTPFAGLEVAGAVERVFLRGRPVLGPDVTNPVPSGMVLAAGG